MDAVGLWVIVYPCVTLVETKGFDLVVMGMVSSLVVLFGTMSQETSTYGIPDRPQKDTCYHLSADGFLI